LEDHIIKQVKLQNDTEKTSSNELEPERATQSTNKFRESSSAMIKSENLEGEVILLKKEI
jgi:hypothetical protein